MTILKRPMSLLILALFFFQQTHAQSRCTAVHGFRAFTQATEAAQREIQLIWYPNSRWLLFSHLELAVEGTLWAADLNLTREGTLSGRKIASQVSGRGFFAFHFQVTPAQSQKLQEDLIASEGKIRLKTCSSGACDFLYRNAGLNIPFPFSQSPTLTAIYVSLMKAMGDKRVVKIEWIGTKNWKQWMTVQPAVELALTYTGVQYAFGFAVTLIDKFGNAVKTIVPVSAQMLP